MTRMEGERRCTAERAEKVVIGGGCESVERKSLRSHKQLALGVVSECTFP